MNRQQRRAALFKRHQRADRNMDDRHLDTALNQLALSRVYDAEKSAALMNDARMAWHRLTHGLGQITDFDMLAEMANTAQIVVLDNEADDFVLETFERGVSSLNTMRARYDRTGQFGADATALQTVPELLAAMAIVFENITPLQAVAALRKNIHQRAAA